MTFELKPESPEFASHQVENKIDETEQMILFEPTKVGNLPLHLHSWR